jgi:hypothetical protein
MELLLNAIWALVSGACFWVWYRSSRSVTRDGRACLFRSLIALACFLAIAFPVISLTDDLHQEQLLVEDASTTVKRLEAARTTIAHSLACTAAAAVQRQSFTPPCTRPSLLVPMNIVRAATTQHPAASESRAPPTSL